LDRLLDKNGNPSASGKGTKLSNVNSSEKSVKYSPNDPELIKLKQENERLTSLLSTTKSDLEKLQKSSEDSRTQKGTPSDEIVTLQSQIVEKDKQIAKMEENLKSIEAKRQKENSEVVKQPEKNPLEEIVQQKDQLIGKLGDDVNKLKSKHEHEVLELKATLTSKDASIKLISRELSKLRRQSMKFVSTENEIDTLNAILRELTDLLTSKEETIREWSTEIDNYKIDVKKQNKTLMVLDKKIMALELDLERKISIIGIKESEISDLRKKNSELTTLLEDEKGKNDLNDNKQTQN
jgi:chromosome segregation ATPase